uniref:HVA22-like protein n=1 Tax=Aegilops tauschii TaxID=37682 RepID=M8CM39_AEGTA
MAALLAPAISGEVGLRLLLAPLSSNIVIRTASCAVGIGLPVYSTYRAIEKKDQDEKERLLLYWAAYGSFSIVESFADKLVSSVPLYYHAKFAILIWLQFPSNGRYMSNFVYTKVIRIKKYKTANSLDLGSKHVYRRYLRPFFQKHQAKIDRILNILSKELTKFVSNHEDEIRFVENMAIRGATTANYIVNGLDQPGQSEEVSVTEDPNPTPTEEPDTPRS